MKASILILLTLFSFTSCKARKHLGVGEKPPAFRLTDQDGHEFNSQDYMGKKILIVYFYPKDESPGCTREACSFRDSYAEFEKEGAVVVGINAALPETHKKFAGHYNLPFLLLSDPGNTVLNLFGVKPKLLISGRETFVIGKDGKIAFTYNSFTDGARHATETLQFLKGAK